MACKNTVGGEHFPIFSSTSSQCIQYTNSTISNQCLMQQWENEEDHPEFPLEVPDWSIPDRVSLAVAKRRNDLEGIQHVKNTPSRPKPTYKWTRQDVILPSRLTAIHEIHVWSFKVVSMSGIAPWRWWWKWLQRLHDIMALKPNYNALKSETQLDEWSRKNPVGNE